MKAFVGLDVHKWIIGSLVAAWLLMGGLAFAEHVNVITETGPHDEQALGHLQLAVKSEARADSIGAPPPDLPHLPVAVHPVAGVL